jgi:hypothetical protein
MPLPRPAPPRVLLADLRAFAAERSKHQWIAAFFAVMMPVTILVLFVLDGRTNIAPAPHVIFVESWAEDRTDEQIRADQLIRQREREKADAERRRQWQELGRRVGMDP